MLNLESVLENETPKLLCEFEIQMDHQISARRPDLVIVNKIKRTCRIVDFAVLADHRVKLKESEKGDKYLVLAKELKRLWKVTVIPFIIGALGTIPKGLVKGLEDLEIRKQEESIIKISQNTEKRPGDLRRLAVTQTPVRNHQLMLV